MRLRSANEREARYEDEILVELKEAKKANRELSKEQKAAFLGELQLYAKTRGYSQGWAAHTYRSKLGVWPNKIEPAQVTEISQTTMGYIKHRMIRMTKSGRRTKA